MKVPFNTLLNDTCEFTHAARDGKIKRYRSLPLKRNIGDIPIVFHKHQLEAFEQIEAMEKKGKHGINGSILMFEMGLGKTLTAISWSLMAPRPSRVEKYGEKGFPTLVVASKSIVGEWKTQGFEKFFDEKVKVLYYHKDYITTKEYNNIMRKDIVEYDFVITTYDVVSSSAKKYQEECFEYEQSRNNKMVVSVIKNRTRYQADNPNVKGPCILHKTPWERVIADESQKFANPKTSLFKAMMSLYGKYKLCLTGTPIRNYKTDIWSQLRFCGYNGVETSQKWARLYTKYIKDHNLRNVIFIRSKKDVSLVIPEKIRHDDILEFNSDIEKQFYKKVAQKSIEVIESFQNKEMNFANALAWFLRLRQSCISPYLMTNTSEKNNSDFKKFIKGLGSKFSKWIYKKEGSAGFMSSKMRYVIDKIKNVPKGEKIIVFSTFVSALNLLEEGINYEYPKTDMILRIDGDVSAKDRIKILEEFKTNPDKKILTMTYSVGCEGLNITCANHIVCMEPWWNYATIAQAEARCHRPGQTKKVHVYSGYMNDTFEFRMLDMWKDKLNLEKFILHGEKYANHSSVKMDINTMKILIGIKAIRNKMTVRDMTNEIEIQSQEFQNNNKEDVKEKTKEKTKEKSKEKSKEKYKKLNLQGTSKVEDKLLSIRNLGYISRLSTRAY